MTARKTVRRRTATTLSSTVILALALPATATASVPINTTPHADPRTAAHTRPGPVVERTPKVATMTGSGGAVTSVDPVASQVGIDVLARGGNAADAAVATAAALGVVEPYANGIGGGGYFVYYDAARKQVSTVDGRESAPRSITATSFLEKGAPMNFAKAVNSGLSVGVPGTPATWKRVLDTWGTRSFADMLAPAEEIAHRGFLVDADFAKATAENAPRFARFPDTAKIFLPGGKPLHVGAVLRQPDLAKAYGELRRHGPAAMYHGQIGKAIVDTVNRPRTAPGVQVPAGGMTMADLAAYRTKTPTPVKSTYKGHDYYGMGGSSSGGVAVAETLNLLEAYEKKTGTPLSAVDEAQYYHRFAEATATAFADRNRWVGDLPGVPRGELVSPGFAAERACGFTPGKAQARPIAFGNPDGKYGDCTPPAKGKPGKVNDGQATTHLTVADKWGNVASYTLTIEQFGGNGMVVPGYGFLLNNELTDFNFAPMTPGVPDPNLPAPGKRPRSSISPSILFKDGRPVIAAGAAGGATIITTTAQTITGIIDRNKNAANALGAPRISSRNTGATAEPSLINSPVGRALAAAGQPMKPVTHIGRGTAIRILGNGRFDAGAEPARGGGGSAMVVRPDGVKGTR
ncbi:gamma-glutamyltranspeptidase / glutathione hydrolase [Austwickia chelonae]|uniref:Glutathione hydrolase proenzyme n=1 Tax=Austwickia chelonae NBRC 105200 TaxID=1184607 RepID=K6VNX9_9MICO|nr:gamma-glutamyltransferase [Austwickia chelonae]GAB77060.1 gamma-glutamyltranspeptidase [Austwickia chelonae NBRC 105200]SEW33697.1 gamma-glutamyltranspeptidase / glutathione hydrolase [Austwickia chelonae]